MSRRVAAAVAVLALATACTPDPPRPPARSPAASPGPPATLRLLAGSELADMQPILDEAAKSTGVTVEMDFTGSLEGAETVATGRADGRYDAIWFSSNRYLETIPEGKRRLSTATRVMTSPVLLGLRTSTARRLGWTGRPVRWAEIVSSAAAGRFTFGMTNPADSNTGFSALVAAASALDGSGRALDAAAIERVAAPLTGFFRAQQLTAGSSGWLTDEFVRRPAEVDGLINYEGSLVGLNGSGKLTEPLHLVYPADGVVSADYPLTLLASSAARDAHERLAAYLRTPEVQRRIGTQTARRPAVAGVPRPDGLPGPPVELPFPETRQSIDALLTAYLDRLRRPTRTVYVLDVSGSMKGSRITALRGALSGLTGVNTSLTGSYCRFRSREEIILLPFDHVPGERARYTIDAADQRPSQDRLRAAISRLRVGGDTAVYDALIAAYDGLPAPDRFLSIVLMTDGESNRGRDLAAYERFLAGRQDRIPVFPVLLGEANAGQMRRIATLTGGAVWDARGSDLTRAFCQIRGYQ